MTLIELLWFILWVGGGSWAGTSIGLVFDPPHAGLFALGGGIIGCVFMVIVIPFVSQKVIKQPPCRCGKVGWKHIKPQKDSTWNYALTCECGRRYLMRHADQWYEILEDNTTRLFKKQDFWGKWIDPTEYQIANQQIQPISGKPGSG